MSGPDLYKFTTVGEEPWMGDPFNVATIDSSWEVGTSLSLLVAKKVKTPALKSKGPPVRTVLFISGLLQQFPKNSVTVSLEQLRQDVGISEDVDGSVVVSDVPVNHQKLTHLLDSLPGDRVRVWKFMISGSEPCLILDEPGMEWRAFFMGLDRVSSSAKLIKLVPEGDQEEPREQLDPEESADVDLNELFNQWA